MEKVHRARIQVNYMTLTKAIRSEMPRLVKYLRHKGLLSDTMEEDILYQRTPSEMAYKFLDTVQTRGPLAFGVFYEAVLDADLWEAADLLEPTKAPHAPSRATGSSASGISHEPMEEDEPLPEKWPSQSHYDNVEDMKLKVKKVTESHTRMNSYFKNPDKNDVFDLNQKKKGKVLIIDNFEFTHGKLANRQGSDKDVKGLRCVFQAIDFDVWVESNKTKQEMEAILDKECTKIFKDYGCFILVMLSHGVRGKVFGTDGIPPGTGTRGNQAENYVEIEEVKRRISNVDSLKGKAKIFIIQACQSDEAAPSGHEQMVQESGAANNENPQGQGNLPSNSLGPVAGFGVTVRQPATNPGNDEDMVIELSKNSADSNQTIPKEPVNKTDSVDGTINSGSSAADAGDINQSSVTHEAADNFTALATVEGYPSYRNTAFGSWFIQAFIYVLANYAHRFDLQALMTKVTKLVIKAQTKGNERQVSETRSTLSKTFFFFPGLPRE